MYAPADEDDPNFMLKAKQALDNMKEDLGLICGVLTPLLTPNMIDLAIPQTHIGNAGVMA